MANVVVAPNVPVRRGGATTRHKDDLMLVQGLEPRRQARAQVRQVEQAAAYLDDEWRRHRFASAAITASVNDPIRTKFARVSIKPTPVAILTSRCRTSPISISARSISARSASL